MLVGEFCKSLFVSGGFVGQSLGFASELPLGPELPLLPMRLLNPPALSYPVVSA
jgi:hypothetical protein